MSVHHMRRDDAEPWHRLCTRIRTGELHSHPGLESRRLRSFKQAAFLLQDGAPGLARAPTSARNQAQIASDRISLCEKDPIPLLRGCRNRDTWTGVLSVCDPGVPD